MDDRAYNTVSSLKEVYSTILKLTEKPVRNLIYQFQIPISALGAIDFLEASKDAELWQSETCPECLYFSHKEYFGADGIAHIKKELVGKPSGKRAIISLLSQREINGRGDDPIPSFMLAQYAKEAECLYATFYYRALETSSFLKINLEEFRMMAAEVKPAGITNICGTIISFYAYQDPGFTNLKRNRLDYIDSQDLYSALKEPKGKLRGLLEELKRPSSVISSKGVQEISRWLDKRSEDFDETLRVPIFRQKISELIKEIDELSALLSRADNFKLIESARESVKRVVEELIRQIEKA